MVAASYDADVARARIERVFRYLAELQRIRTPPALDLDRYEWILRLDALPRHATIQRGFGAVDAADNVCGEASRTGFLLGVERPTETECPAPSVLFENWLEPGWEQPGVTPAVMPARPLRTTDREESFEDKEARVLAFEDWLDERRRWEASQSQVIAAAHAETGGPAAPELDLSEAVFDSALQGELCPILDGEGYRVVPHYAVGSNPIDVVVQGPGNARVGILCDGGKPLPDHDLRGVLEHQMILERLGWKLIRIRASEYFRDPKKELERLRRRLGARGVKPVDPERARSRGKPADPPGPGLHERVIRRAESIRSRWNIALPPRPAPEAAATRPPDAT